MHCTFASLRRRCKRCKRCKPPLAMHILTRHRWPRHIYESAISDDARCGPGGCRRNSVELVPALHRIFRRTAITTLSQAEAMASNPSRTAQLSSRIQRRPENKTDLPGCLSHRRPAKQGSLSSRQRAATRKSPTNPISCITPAPSQRHGVGAQSDASPEARLAARSHTLHSDGSGAASQ